MKPTKMLIAGLYSAADRIEHGTDYDWHTSYSCNCGILAQELLGKNTVEMMTACMNEGIGTWSLAVHLPCNFCYATGLPVRDIFVELHKHGLEQRDFELIEFCKLAPDPDAPNYRDQKFVASFFRQLAGKLEQERKTTKQKYESNNETTVDNTETCLINS